MPTGPTCPHTRRTSYTRAQALVMHLAAKHHAPHVPRRVTACGFCGGWHITPRRKTP